MTPLSPCRPGDAGRLCVCCGRLGRTLSSGLCGVLQPPHQFLAVHWVCQDGRHKSCSGGPGRTALCYWYETVCTQAYLKWVLPTVTLFVKVLFAAVLLAVHWYFCVLVGGAVLEDGDGTDLAQVYNPKTSAWTEVSPMQIARSGSAACTLKGKLYVIGIVLYSTLSRT